jgi:SdrD B-like domain
VPNVTLNLTGDTTTSTTTDGSGNYMFSSLASGTYVVTPSKAALAPASTGIDTVDVISTQRHFLNLGTPLSGCRLTAADVNGDNSVDIVDVPALLPFSDFSSVIQPESAILECTSSVLRLARTREL